MRNNTIVGMLRWMTVSCFVLIGYYNSFSQQVKLPTDTTFSENLRMEPDHDMNPGDEFDLYFDMTGFPAGTMYTALMHIDDVEIAMGYSTGSPMHVTVPRETIPGKYGIKVVAITALPPQPKTVLVRDSLNYVPSKWTTVSGNTNNQLIFTGAGTREATLKPVNMARGGYMQIDFHWTNPGNNSANSQVLAQYSIDNGKTWITFYTLNPKVNYQSFVHMDLPKGAASTYTMVRFIQPNHTAADGWRMDLVLQTENGNVVMPNYYENIHFSVKGNPIKLSPLTSTKLCAGEQINLAFTTSGTYPAGNVFIAQLSDNDGFFKTPVEVGRLTSNKSGSISVKIPNNLIHGIRYRLRITSEAGGKTNTTSKPTEFMELGPILIDDVVKNGNILTAPQGTSYQWYNGTTLLEGETNRTFTAKVTGDYICEVTNENGCSYRTQEVPLTIQVTAIKDTENNYFKVYPNPTNDRVILTANNDNISGTVELRIVNVYGQTILKNNIDASGAEMEINLSTYDQGLYYLVLQNKDLTIVKQIVKK